MQTKKSLIEITAVFEKIQQRRCWNRVRFTVTSESTYSFSLLLAFLLTFSSTAWAQLPQVLYLPFDEGAGAATADLSVPGQSSTNATLTNSNSWNLVDPYLGNSAWEPSTAIGGLNVVNVGTTYSTLGSFTFEFALKPVPFPMFSALDILNESLNLRVSLHENTVGEFRLRIGSVGTFGVTVVNDFGPPLPLHKWTYVSLVYDATLNLLFLYFDATSVDVVFPIAFGGLPGLSLANGGGTWRIGSSPGGSFNTWNGSIDEFRVWNVARSPALIRMTSKVELANGVIDVGAGEITSPPRRLGRCQYYSSAEVLSVVVCNPGLTPIAAGSAIPMTVSVDGSVVMTESLVLANNLNPGESLPFTFANTIDLKQAGVHTVRVTTNFPGDTQPDNDVLELDFRGGGPGVVAEFPWLEDFDDEVYPTSTPAVTTVPPFGWHQRQGELNPLGFEEEWFFIRSPQFGGYSGFLPDTDHTSRSNSGRFANLDTGVPQRSIESPCIELHGLTNPTLAFYYNRERWGSLPLASARLRVRVHSLTTGLTTRIFLQTLNDGPDVWRLFRADLSPWIDEVIVLYFEGVGGSSNTMSVDDVTIIDESTTLNGQAPQPGLATLDLNGATNANVQEVASGENGIYQTVNFSPTDLNYEFQGLPLQPVMLLSGDRNLRNATFPGIGQMDMGGPIDPVTGIPGALTIWGNGFTPTAGHDYLFYTDATGALSLQATMPFISTFPLPFVHRIPFATFQAVMGVPTAPYFAISNAVELLQW